MAMWSPPTDTGSPMSPPYSSPPPKIVTPELTEDPRFDSPPKLMNPETSLPVLLSPSTISNPLAPSSMPSTPQLSNRPPSGGKIREGFKRMFRPPLSQASLDRSNPQEDQFPHSDGTTIPKLKRYNKLRIRTFRRIRRRSDKGQYHSDDGYTSDPGPPLPDDPVPSIDMDEDEETDGADSSEGHGPGVESRAGRQKKELERKLEKTKNQLLMEQEHYQETQNTHLHDLEATADEKAQQRIKSRLKRDHMKSHAVIEQNRKKIEKYERDLALLQEGGAKEGLRGKIEEGLKIPFVGIKKGFNIAGNTLKRGKRYIIRTRSSQGGDLGEGELDGDGKYAVVIEEEEEEGEEARDNQMLVYEASDMVTVPKTTLDELHEQQEELKRQMEKDQTSVNTLEEVMSEILSKIGQVKDTYERLQEQVNDVIDLHQNAVGELRGQLSQVESMTVTKTQDLEDVMDEYQSKVEKLDNLIHNEIERKAEVERARNCMMMVVARVVTFALQTIAIILKLISVLSTRTGSICAAVIVIIAILYLFWTSSN